MIHSRGLLIWLGVILASAVLLGIQLWRDAPLDTRITVLLPESANNTLFQHTDQRLADALEQRFLILITGPNDATAAQELRKRLHDSGVITRLDEQSPPRPDLLLAPYRYRLLAPSLAQATPEDWTKRGLSRLFTPGVAGDLVHDPFGLLDAWLSARLASHVEWRDGGPVVTTPKATWQLISATLAASPYDMELQRRLNETLDRFTADYPDLTLLRSGLVFHAAAGAQQAQREATTIGVGSLLGVLLMLWLVFRRPALMATLLVPVASGLLFASAITWTLFGSLNLITLAFGASLIGISVDYALHLQCMRQLHPQRPLSALWPGLFLSLVSSLCAYLVLMAPPIPGLRQMATFTACGLFGAWLSVRLCLPCIPLRSHPATQAIALRLNGLRLGSHHRNAYVLMLLVLLAALLLAILAGHSRHDLRQLNSSPQALIDQQQRAQALLGQPAGFRYLILQADTPETLLQRLETMDVELSRLHHQGHLSSYRHLAQVVPSRATQESNLQTVTQRYQSALPSVLQQAGLPSEQAGRIWATLEKVPTLTPDIWLDDDAGETLRPLWFTLNGTPSAVILLGDLDKQGLAKVQALSRAPGTLYRDRVNALSSQLEQLSTSIIRWLALAMLVLGAAFLWRYRLNAWRVLLPPVGAVILTLGIFAALQIGLSLFHLLGLLLVLGIGLDAGIFSTEHPDDPAAWLAITLSCASSLLAFGLLAFSATPALHFLGTTCLIGLTATWCLVPFSRSGKSLAVSHTEKTSHGHR